MIKFFRRIRQRLLAENRISKYALYAVGEIFLVVIGILIALQINNWNENRKQKMTSRLLVERLKQALNRDIENITYRIDDAKNIKKSLTTLMSMFGESPVEGTNSEIDSLLSWATRDYLLSFNLNPLLEARDNGEISLINSDSLKSKLYEFIGQVEFINEREKNLNEDKDNYLVPFLYDNVNMRNIPFRFKKLHKEKVGDSKLEASNYDVLFQNRKFENMLNQRFLYSEERIITYQYVEMFLKELRNMLIKENEKE
ncbi:hypothetical protein BWZ20_02465 [Winogradskyella sp. J14-2]|uniref:DUF6090 family protein n=1 Tax=Winogradskyella sp. J14-2 TaxID=1936080 RepID=UPI0009729A74|nr:DUF6090 family protein [Winogradskyella sp. J14-2]APY07236.1 hypothetical protein BWZ20_02465 [Winogradskyella sp. J14-2]